MLSDMHKMLWAPSWGSARVVESIFDQAVREVLA